ncbi:META domain-containing protein [Winogradskyella sp.]|uniref:META domain-containing protein n=1 Tax=Winogradskyella sp. TaxID=1883156 RepID=UPI003BAD0DE5
MKVLLSIFSLLVLTNGCSTSKNAMDTKSLDQNSISGDYLVTQIDGKTTKDSTLKIAFEANSNRVTGFGGCNSFFGTYTLDNNTISFSDLAASKKYCGKDISSAEQHFLSTLKTSNKIALTDNGLVLYNEDVVVLMADRATVSQANNKGQNRKVNLETNGDSTLITYRVQSRDIFEYIQISKSTITTSNDRYLKAMESYTCQPEDWESLNELLQDIDIEHLDKLKAPTDKRLFDGAPHATLSVIRGDVETMSPSFDHGTPPDAIKALVNKVLSIRENLTKQ